MKTVYRDYKVVYEFTKSNFGFQNQITINSNNEGNAKRDAIDEIAKVYGSAMVKFFKIIKVTIKN